VSRSTGRQGGGADLAGETKARVSFTAFSVFFVVIGALMALWIDARFPRLAPEELRAAAIRLGAAFLVAQLAVPAAGYVAAPLSETARIGIALTIGFCALTLLMLATVWVVKIAQGLVGGRFR
jgi:hypothetical protein